jgi:DNA-binding response OmpR family regulator
MIEAPKKILCIEDDHEVAALIEEELVERGYHVIVAHDGNAGLAAILKERPDLTLCDINMPIMSGFDVLERLTDGALRLGKMPFVFLTALGDRESEIKGRKLGADDYVTKPIDFEILASVIAARLSHVARDEVWVRLVDLTSREIETLTWSARGKTSAEIATILGLTKRTIDFHLDNAKNKLGAETRVQAVVRATSTGLIDP